ncbi:MAG: hypothetical protein WC635_11955 [Bacteriovorax sp.]|jgi:hypothetical protein
MRFSFILLCLFSSIAQASGERFNTGDEVFDTRSFRTGVVIQQLDNGSVEVKLDTNGALKIYSDYYAAELAPKLQECDRGITTFCSGDKFLYSLTISGNNKEGEILGIFKKKEDNKYGKFTYVVQIEGESKIRFLTSDHRRFMSKQ